MSFNFTCNPSPFRGVITLLDWQLYALVALNVTAFVCNIASNSFVIYSIARVPKNFYLRLILLLSCSDVFGAVTVQLMSAVLMLAHARTSFCALQTATQFFSVLAGHVSAYIIALIGFDRYLRMRFLTTYAQVVTPCRQIFAVLTAVSLGMFHAILYAVAIENDFLSPAKKITLAVDIVVTVAVIASYVCTIRIVRGYRQQASNKVIMKQANKAINTVASRILLALCLTYITYIIVNIVVSLTYSSAALAAMRWLDFSAFSTYAIIYSNATVNALIFVASNKQARNVFAKKVSCARGGSEFKSNSGSQNKSVSASQNNRTSVIVDNAV